jgi:hypothetical protein
MKRAAFLFGSGISQASGAPTVNQISDALLNQGWHDEDESQKSSVPIVKQISNALLNQIEHDEFRFSRSPTGTESTGKALLAQKFLRILKSYINPRYILHENRDAHYEDLYAAAMQIFQDETSGIVEPMIHHSVAEIRYSVRSLYQDQEAGIYTSKFARLVHSGIRLIEWGVFHLLLPADKPKGMQVLSAVAKATQQMDIFSLNHDLLIERELEREPGLNRIRFTDGFTEEDGNAIKYNHKSWHSDIPVRLYKLHGSLDWFRFAGFSDDDDKLQFAKVPREFASDTWINGKGKNLLLQPTNTIPLLLIGTNGKEQLYGAGIIGEIFLEFLVRLREHRTLICCGYGWEDKGINKRLYQWLLNSKENQIVILHNAAAELKQKQFWIKREGGINRWDHWEQKGRLKVVPKWLGCCTLTDLEPYIDNYEQQSDVVQLP